MTQSGIFIVIAGFVNQGNIERCCACRIDLAPAGADLITLAVDKGYWGCAAALVARPDAAALGAQLGSSLAAAVRAGRLELVRPLADWMRGRGCPDEGTAALVERALLHRGCMPG